MNNATAPDRDISVDLAATLAEARASILAAPDPAGALRRLSRHVRRERDFARSPAAVPLADLVAARTAGIPSHLTGTVRRDLADVPDIDPLPAWAR